MFIVFQNKSLLFVSIQNIKQPLYQSQRMQMLTRLAHSLCLWSLHSSSGIWNPSYLTHGKDKLWSGLLPKLHVCLSCSSALSYSSSLSLTVFSWRLFLNEAHTRIVSLHDIFLGNLTLENVQEEIVNKLIGIILQVPKSSLSKWLAHLTDLLTDLWKFSFSSYFLLTWIVRKLNLALGWRVKVSKIWARIATQV